MAETTVGSFRTKSSADRARGVNQAELATAEWVVCFNTERPHKYLDDFTPKPSRSSTTITDAPHQRRGQREQSPETPGRVNQQKHREVPHRQILRKLGVNSRAEAAAAVLEIRGPTQRPK
ncbi:transposase (plasmid) [Mycolicibacterium rufum]|uniref:Transposase n=3 Tax=Mycobacteriaceae TaxID=1762 RepID=A0ABY5TST9_9MYCO|nr:MULTISPECIES: integrase core domain-containing protein [Mycobacteriaceae]UVY95916.1 transposase [Mycolicibacterium rufum]